MHFPSVSIDAARRCTGWLGALCVAGLLALTGCTKPPLTQEVIASYDLDAERMRHLQLYTSSEIVLLQEVTQRQSEDQIGVQLTQRVETRRVVIAKGTPGVALRFEGDLILVGFVPGKPQFSLWFSRKHDRADVAIEHEESRLSHLDNPIESEGSFEPHYPNSRIVRYNGGNYRPEHPLMWDAFLVFDGEALNERDIIERPEGWRVDQASSK